LYQANFVSRINKASPVLGGVRAQPFLIQQVIPRPSEVLGPSHDLGLGVAFVPFLVRCPIGIDYILDLIFPAHLSLGHNYAEFPYFYLKSLVMC
jgi:hypothetical protein